MEDFDLRKLNVYDNVEVGLPHIKINDAAEKYEADIIIMGTHGTKGLKDIFIGSNAEKVVHHANCPVLSIKEILGLNPSNIIFASDFSKEADHVFERVKTFADIFGAKIHLLKVITMDNFESLARNRSIVNDFLKRHNVMNYSYTIYPFNTYIDQKIQEGILRFVKEIKGDLIAIGTHGRHGLARFFIGSSISEDLVNHSFCPVLTVNFEKEKYAEK